MTYFFDDLAIVSYSYLTKESWI